MTRMVPVVVVIREDHVPLLDQWDAYCRARNPDHAAALEQLQDANGWQSYMVTAGAFLGANLAEALANVDPEMLAAMDSELTDPLAGRLRYIANQCEQTPAYAALHGMADELDATPLHYERVSIWEQSQDGEYAGWVAKFKDGAPCDQLWGMR